MRAFFHALGAPFRALLDPEGRRAWALILLAGGGFMMTAYAIAALYFVRKNPAYVFTLGLAAHVSIVLVLTGFAGLLIKRTIKVAAGDRVLDISDQPDPATISAAAAGAAAGAIAGAKTQ
jgi:hypothetical protein